MSLSAVASPILLQDFCLKYITQVLDGVFIVSAVAGIYCDLCDFAVRGESSLKKMLPFC